MKVTLERWNALWQSLGVAAPVNWFERLKHSYSAPDRHYHNLQHLDECLTEWDAVRNRAQDPDAGELALWFHDAVYDSRASDNESRSADWADQCLAEAGLDRPSVRNLILATRLHETHLDADAGWMVDVDLSILGREESRFWEYERQIRAEYAWVPAEVFAAKRAEVLRRFLKRERLYATPEFSSRFEAQARQNLTASLAQLSSDTSRALRVG